MSGFDLVFAAFGLLLGLAISEVLGGFSRALKLKRGARAVRIGWLTPLLGLFVLLDLTSFWLTAYEARAQMDANYLTLTAVLALVGVYYLAATLIFPDEPEDWPDFDQWYDRHKRLVIGGVLCANIGNIVGQVALEIYRPSTGPALSADADYWMSLALLGLFGALIALLFVRHRWVNGALLVALIAILLVGSVYMDQQP
ncbi:hypothetical protein [Sphingobium cupriresistens]|uniref:Uncharacterized protein n=1 Tax=Sphingobium cupriresistens LL01 TaxID=1420583 RepID=A0A0J7XV07_9SPHN|nr:hypothetical protein [Sphingobium cupriresistens]KMS55581.1 hypothetical protein V473_12620 [Sphingobium cupriresistens LL01]